MRRVLVVACFGLVCASCSGADDGASWMAQVSDASARADRLAAREQTRAGATSALEEALALPAPDDVADADRRAVRQDLWFRLSRLALAAGDSSRALAAAERGVAEGEADDVFFANLLVARARARGARARSRGVGRLLPSARAQREAHARGARREMT